MAHCERCEKSSMFSIFANGIRHTLVHIYDLAAKMQGEEFKAGYALAVEEMSVRLLGEHLDTYEEAVRAELKEESVNQLAAEFEQVLDHEVLEGRCELIIGADGTKRYSTKAGS